MIWEQIGNEFFIVCSSPKATAKPHFKNMMKKIVTRTLKEQGQLPEITYFKGLEAFNNICPEQVKRKWMPLLENNMGELQAGRRILSPFSKNKSAFEIEAKGKWMQRCLSHDRDRSPRTDLMSDSFSRKDQFNGFVNLKVFKGTMRRPKVKLSKDAESNNIRVLNRESIERNYIEITRRIRHKVRDERVVYRRWLIRFGNDLRKRLRFISLSPFDENKNN